MSSGKPVVFTRHARLRMADPARGLVSEDEVIAVLSSPAVEYVGVDGKSNVLGDVNGKHLRVCFDEDANRILIITVINRR